MFTTKEEFKKLCESAANLDYLVEECDSSDELIYADIIDVRNKLKEIIAYAMKSVKNKSYGHEYVKITKEVLNTDFYE